jgi:hypothetical protein
MMIWPTAIQKFAVRNSSTFFPSTECVTPKYESRIAPLGHPAYLKVS